MEKKENKLITIQEMLMREMGRLDDNNYMQQVGVSEIARSNALTNNALTYIKAVNVQLRIKEVATKFEQTEDSIKKEIGLNG